MIWNVKQGLMLELEFTFWTEAKVVNSNLSKFSIRQGIKNRYENGDYDTLNSKRYFCDKENAQEFNRFCLFDFKFLD